MAGLARTLLIACLCTAPQAMAACLPGPTYKGIALHRFPGAAYAYRTSRIAIDADGAPNAYHPQDRGIDALANAGFPNGGWKNVLVSDPANPARPFIQQTGEFKGFFVSTTTLQDTSRPATDPARYVDARKVPYIVFPGRFFAIPGTGRRGVLGMARNLSTGQTSPMIHADAGAADHELGEVSIRLAENLGGQNVNPRNGQGVPRGPFAYVLFPGSEASPPWPVDPAVMQRTAQAELDKIGGWDAVLACVGAR